MHHEIVQAGKRTVYTWSKSMLEVAVPGSAAPVLLHNALHWAVASCGRRVGLMTRNHGRHHKPLPMQHLGAVIARLQQKSVVGIII